MLALCRSDVAPKPNKACTPSDCRYAIVSTSWSLLVMAAIRASSGFNGALPFLLTLASSIQDSYISPIFCITEVRLGSLADAFSRMLWRNWRLYSASSLKRPQRAWSEGIGLFLRHVPQAY